MQNRKIAIIGQDKKSIRDLQEILSGGGYIPIPVSDSILAVDTVIQKKPDVILVDLRMSRKNTFEHTGAINRVFETRQIPIIAVSNSFNEEYSFLLDLCGIKKCIKKPFLPLDVIWAIENEITEAKATINNKN